MKLTQAALLGALVTEHGACIPESLNLIVQQAVLITGAHTAGGTLWTQTQAVAIAVFKGVHFFFDYIGHFTDGALKQFGLLENRKANFSVAVARQHIGDHCSRYCQVGD